MPPPPRSFERNRTPTDRVLAGCAASAWGVAAGGLLAGVGFVGAALRIEANRPPEPVTLSYGQAAGLISLPLVVLWGAAVGAGAGLFLAGRRRLGATVQLLAAAAGTFTFLRLRAADLMRHGPDFSQTVLYEVPVAVGLTVGAAAALLCAGAAVVRGARR